MKTTILLFAFFFAFPIVIIAQITNPLDERYMPPATSVFGSKLNKQVYARTNTDSDQPDNAIKIPVLELIRGEFRLTYERKIVKGISLEAGIGAPFTGDFINRINSDFMAGLWGDPEMFDNLYGLPVLPLHAMLRDGSFDSGFLYSVALRYYFPYGNNAPSYIDLTVRNVYREYYLYGSNYRSRTFFNQNTFIAAHLGFSWETGESKARFVNSFAFGLGVKLGKWDEFKPNDSGIINPVFYPTGNERSSVSPLVSVKYNMGICW